MDATDSGKTVNLPVTVKEETPSFKIDNRYFLPVALVALTIFGLACKFLLALNTNLNSDSVVPGLEAMEILRYGDIFLSQFYYPTNYPAIFTDLVPFHLIPQLLTGYDPNAIRLTGFLIFVLTVAVYAAIVYKVTKDRVKALLFMALLSNLTPLAYNYFKEPVAHAGTFLMAGILIFLLIDYQKLRSHQKAMIAALVFLISLSDNITLAIIAIPVTLVLAYNRFRADKKTIPALIDPAVYLLLPGLLAYAVKILLPSMVAMSIWLITDDHSIVAVLGLLPGKFMLYVNYSLTVFNDQLISILNQNMGVFEILSLALAALAIFALVNVIKAYKNASAELRSFLQILLASNVIVFLGFMATSLNGARYLMLGPLSIFAIIALGYDKRKMYLALVAVTVIMGAITCAIAVSHLDYKPNQDEYRLINYLEENNLTIGYSDYWDSNVLTYLSGEKVKVRSIGYRDGFIVPYHYRILSSSRWYTDSPTKFFILYDHNVSGFSYMPAIISAIEWDHVIHFGDYDIFIYNKDPSPVKPL